MSGIILRWMGGGAGDTICNLLASNNPNTYMNFKSKGLDDGTGRSMIIMSHDEWYPSLSNLGRKNASPPKEQLKKDLLKLIKNHKKFILRCHYFDHKFDNLLKGRAEVNDIGVDLDFLPFIVQAIIAKIPKSHPMYELKYKLTYRKQSASDQMLQKISRKLSNHQKKQVLIWNLISDAVKRINEFDLGNTAFSTQDLFYNNKRIEDFFKGKGYEINLDVPYLSNWKNINKIYLPSEKYQSCLKNNKYEYTNKKELSIVERYIFLLLSGKRFIFLD